jgi:hypothetical protein
MDPDKFDTDDFQLTQSLGSMDNIENCQKVPCFSYGLGQFMADSGLLRM